MTFDVDGAWTRESVAIDGSEPFEFQRVYWLQAGDRYADLRVPFVPTAAMSCFAGRSGWDGDRFRWTHDLDLAGSDALDAVDIGDLSWDGDRLIERGTLGEIPYEEVWVRLPDSDNDDDRGAAAGAAGAAGAAVMSPGACQVRVGSHAITIVDDRPTGGSFNACYQVRTPVGWQTRAQIGDLPEGALMSSHARKWEEQAWPELQDLAARGDGEVGLVPVGATEQHGPHLPTGTDTIIATALCELASEITQAPVLPAIPVACSYGHGTVIPGTLSLTPQLLAAVAIQYAEWAATSGLTRLVFVNAHFGNAASLATATDHLRLFRPDLRVAAVDWWNLDAEVKAEMVVDGDDLHANRGETSVMLALAPHLVDVEAARTADDADRTEGLVFRYTAPALSTNGVTGRPSEATPELGSRLVGLTVSALVALIERARTEKPPLGPAPFPGLTPQPSLGRQPGLTQQA